MTITLTENEARALLELKALIHKGHPDMDEFLFWIYARMKEVHKEHELVDYMHALHDYASGIAKIKRYLT